jgi:cytochrome oxidase assembly protein ShyY1
VLQLLLTPRWIGRLVLLLVVVAACAWLGWWQWDRAWVEIVRTPPQSVVPLQEVHQPGQPVDTDQVGRRVQLTGMFDPTREVLVVDRQSYGRTGFWVVTSFVVDDAEDAVIPVVRGWLPQDEPVPTAPDGTQELVAWLESTESDALRERGRDPLPEGQVEVVSSAELLSLWQSPLFQGFVIQQQPEPEPPLEPVAPPALTVTEVVNWQNAAYGVQWWLFGLFAVFWFVRMVRVEREDRTAEADARDATAVDTMEGPAGHGSAKG